MQRLPRVSVEIIFADGKDFAKLNRRLVHYFKNNLDIINRNNVKCLFKIAHKEEFEFYEEKGIDSFPVLINDKQKKYGVDGIIQSLGHIQKGSVKKIQSEAIQKQRNPSKAYEDMLESMMDPKQPFDDNTSQNDFDPMKGMTQMLERRKQANAPPINGMQPEHERTSPAQSGANVGGLKKSSGDAMLDQLLAKNDYREDNIGYEPEFNVDFN